jgi:methionyl-tRNA formyltransferase
MSRLRLAFLGSPDFAVPALEAVHGAHDVACVYTQPPRPAGRGHAVTRCPVHVAADRLGLPVRHPVSLKRDAAAQADFAALDLDAAVVAAYGLILPQVMLDAPRRGCLNIHASLLPRWRGAGPIQAAVLAGDAESGVTIMQMEAGLDTGPMLLREAVAIGPRGTASALHDALAALGGPMVLRVLAENPEPQPQPAEGVTYAPKLTRADGRLDWAQPAETLDRQIRALNPWPGAWCTPGLEGWGEGVLKILDAVPVPGSGAPGAVLEGLTIACGSGALRLLRVQRAGRGPMEASAFLNGQRIPPGAILG